MSGDFSRRSVIKRAGTVAAVGLGSWSATQSASAYSLDDNRTDSASSDFGGDADLYHATNLAWDASYEDGQYVHRFRLTGVGVMTYTGSKVEQIKAIVFIPTADDVEMIMDGIAPGTPQTDYNYSPNTASIYKAKEEAEDISNESLDYDMYKSDMECSYGQEDMRWQYAWGNYREECCYQLRFNVYADKNADYAFSIEVESDNRMVDEVQNIYNVDANGTDLDVSFTSD